MQSCVEMLLAFGAMAILCAALMGWGIVVHTAWAQEIAPPGAPRAQLGLTMALGLSAILAGCGVLEWLEMASRTSLSMLVGTGVAAAILLGRRVIDPQIFTQWRFGAVWLAFLAITVAYLSFWNFNVEDDFLGYFVFPQRVLAQGSLGLDWANLRRVEMGLGGAAYLDTLFVCLAPLSRLGVLEPGLAGMMLGCCAMDWSLRHGASLRQYAAAVLVIYVGMAAYPVLNVCPVLPGSALLIGVLSLWLEADSRLTETFKVFCTAALLAALVVLKTQMIVFAGAAFGVCVWANGRLLVWRHLCLLAGTAALCLAPWMLASWHHTHTAFYPLLGAGMANSAALRPVHWSRFGKTLILLLPHLAACLMLAPSWGTGTVRARRMMQALVVGQLALWLFFAAVFQVGAVRYLYPWSLAMWCLFFWQALLHGRTEARGRRQTLALCATFAVFTAYTGMFNPIMAKGMMFDSFVGGPSDFRGLEHQQAVRALSLLQSKTPPGAALLVRVPRPFVLDFGRNPLFVQDWPGSTHLPCSPCGLEASSQQLATGLLQSGIRYLLFDYAHAQHFARDPYFLSFLQQDSPWLRGLVQNTLQAERQLLALADVAQVVFDDGQRFVLDLAAAAHAPAADERT